MPSQTDTATLSFLSDFAAAAEEQAEELGLDFDGVYSSAGEALDYATAFAESRLEAEQEVSDEYIEVWFQSTAGSIQRVRELGE